MRRLTIAQTIAVAILLSLMCLSAAMAAKVNLKPAIAALEEGRYQDAVDLLLEGEKSDARNNQLYRLLGDAYTGLGNAEKAEEAYRRAVDLKGSDREALLKWGNSLIAVGQIDEALATLRKGLKKAKKDPEKAAFNDAIGRALVASGDCSEAQQYLLKATIQDEPNPRYHLGLGDAYFDCQVYSLAKIEYQVVLDVDSDNCLAWYRIGFAEFRDRAFSDALQSFGKAYLCDTTYIPVYYDLALLYVLSARSVAGDKAVEYYQNALFYFERYRTAWPDSNKVLVAKNISLAYYYLRDYEKAAEELGRAIDVGVDDPQLLFLLGRSLQLLERYEEAIARFDQYETGLTDADTASAELYVRRGTCRYLMTTKDSTLAQDPEWLALAVKDFQSAIESDSNDTRSISIVAQLLNGRVLKRYEDAIWYFDRMSELYPAEARYWYNAAVPRLKLKRDLETLMFLDSAIALDTLDTSSEGKIWVPAMKIAGPIVLKAGDYTKARKYYRKLMNHEPNNCDHVQWYAFTYHVAEQYDRALPHLEKTYSCLKKAGKKPCDMRDITLWLAQAYSQTNQLNRAEPLVDQGLKCDPDDKEFKEIQNSILMEQEIDYTPGQKAGQQ